MYKCTIYLKGAFFTEKYYYMDTFSVTFRNIESVYSTMFLIIANIHSKLINIVALFQPTSTVFFREKDYWIHFALQLDILNHSIEQYFELQ